MKSIFLFIFIAASTQATEWASIRPLVRSNVDRFRSYDVTSRITGGNEATPGQFPFIAALILDGVGVCGGSLISENIVLSAGHCLEGFITIEVNLGAHNIYDFEELGRVTVITRDIHVHENYNLYDLITDIGFVRLAEPVVLSPTIELIRMPSRSQESETFAGFLSTAVGWGVYNSSIAVISPVLKYAELNILSNAECAPTYPEGFLSDTHLCAVEVTGNACNSDSGGPLLVTESDGISTLVAITSFGPSRICEDILPGGFTRVTSFFDWIENNTGVVIRP